MKDQDFMMYFVPVNFSFLPFGPSIASFIFFVVPAELLRSWFGRHSSNSYPLLLRTSAAFRSGAYRIQRTQLHNPCTTLLYKTCIWCVVRASIRMLFLTLSSWREFVSSIASATDPPSTETLLICCCCMGLCDGFLLVPPSAL